MHVDSVFDLSRMMRIPDSYNNKQLNGEAPQLVTARLDSGGPLTMAEVSERLDEAGIVERVEDRAVSGAEVSPPDTWECADRTCTYVAKMINRWVTDRPPPGGARNPYVYNRHIRLFCALRNGCVSADNFQRAQQILDDVLTELVTTTEPRRNVRLYEFHELRKYGIVRTASKTDDEVHAKLGCHNHPGVNVPAPAANGQQPPPGGGQAHSSQQTGGQQAGGGQASSGPAAGQQAPAPLHRPRGSRWTSVRGSAALSSRRHRRSASPAPTVAVHLPGREHAVLGETESGKTWFALGCVVAELTVGHRVVYIHYEEADPGSTIERLQLLGVTPLLIATCCGSSRLTRRHASSGCSSCWSRHRRWSFTTASTRRWPRWVRRSRTSTERRNSADAWSPRS